jgi:hypothetical protein
MDSKSDHVFYVDNLMWIISGKIVNNSLITFEELLNSKLSTMLIV